MVKKKGKSSAMAVEGESYSYGMHAATTDRHHTLVASICFFVLTIRHAFFAQDRHNQTRRKRSVSSS